MSKDYINPFLLLVAVILLACRVTSESTELASWLGVWLAALCVTALVVNAALAVARALAHRRALMSVVWAVVFLIMGSCMLATPGGPRGEEEESFQRLLETYRREGAPSVRDAEGNSLLELAAGLGKLAVVKELTSEEAQAPKAVMERAAAKAAENNQADALAVLLDRGVSPHAVVNGVPLLGAAAQNGRVSTMRLLLQRGADPNGRDEEGYTPLMQAVLSDYVPAVQLLMRSGADASLLNQEGRDAASYSRREEMDQALSAPRP